MSQEFVRPSYNSFTIGGGVKLKPHQQKAVDFMDNNYGLILYHSTGSGKTITSLVAMYKFNKPIIIIGPKSARKAFEDEISRLGYDKSRLTMYSFTKAKNEMYHNLDMMKGKCVIVDEAHHLRTPTRDNTFLTGILSLSYKIMLLTATPIINYPNDLSNLVNIVKNEDVLPTDRYQFDFFYFDEQNMEVNNEHMLRNKLSNCVSYYKIATDRAGNDENYPKHKTVTVKVPMSKKQLKEYANYVKKFIYDDNVPMNVDLLDINFEYLQKSKKNAFLSATRQLSNTIDGSVKSPKMIKIFKAIKKGNYPAVIYSNYLKNGVLPIAKKLHEYNISYKLITGETSLESIQKIVNDYNNGKYKVLILSSAGSESLDLKNTREIHIMEPHWNEAKIDQVIGRAIRYKSHSSLPKNERFVKIYRWISVFPEPIKNISADEYLTMISERKEKILEIFDKIIIESSIEKSGEEKRGGYYYKYVKYKAKYLKLRIN
jgi:superfamily II DNA or RNA helicase